jgi:hypothetical protein
MTEQEIDELIYLQDLVFESAKWRISEDDPCGCIEREVRDRLDKLQQALRGKQDEAAVPEFDPEWTKSAQSKVKLNYKGRILRLPRYMLEQRPCKQSHTGYQWCVREEYEAEADAKVEQLNGARIGEKSIDKLSDELWAEHENS